MGYKIVMEIEALDAKDALQAAKDVEKMIMDEGGFQYYVQNEETGELFSVDLSEDDEDAVLPVKEYKPSIK